MILDLYMPVMSGEELLARISKEEKYRNLPILVATGVNDSEVEKRCLKLGAWDYIAKPFDRALLLQRLSSIIVAEQNRRLKQSNFVASLDALTGLYNRDSFMRQAQKIIQENPETEFALIRMDIDRFRLYNAAFGSKAGDTLLKRFATMLGEGLRQQPLCVYGRIESDVFGLLMPNLEAQMIASIEKSAATMREACGNYRLSFSFGIYVITDNNINMEEAYSYASEATKKCKESPNTTYVYYDSAMHAKLMNEQRIVSLMEQGIRERQFVAYLQPKYSLALNAPCGAEALVRWIHPDRGMISPGDFIPIFEQNGFIDRLDHYMWEEICRLLQKWLSEGMKVDPISVNVSQTSLYGPTMVQDLLALTEQYHVPHGLINLEITESAYMSNPDYMRGVIEQLRKNGFIIAMDDFGSGYSSLNTLRDIEMDYLKVDMKYLPSGKDNEKSEKIMASITHMANWLGIPVIAEGVETEEQKDFLISIGCAYVQGYFFARPMPVETYEKMVLTKIGTAPVQTAAAKVTQADVEALWSSETKIGMLLKTIEVPFAILEYSEGGCKVSRRNPAYIRMFGDRSDTTLSEEENKKLNMAMERAIAGSGGSRCDCMYMLSDGMLHWVHIRFEMLKIATKSAAFAAIFQDVTPERQLEMELRKALNAGEASRSGKIGMLILDDAGVDTRILRGLFEQDFTIYTAANAKAAMETLYASSGKITVILMDMAETETAGKLFLSQKNALPKAADIPVIVISDDTSEFMQVNMLKSGVSDYITKPFVPQMLYKRVQNVLEYSSRFRALMQQNNGAAGKEK